MLTYSLGTCDGLMMYFSFAECVQIEIEIMNTTVEWW